MIYTELPAQFFPMLDAVGCFVEYDDTFVLLQRQGHKSEPFRWGIPSGKIEPGETKDAAVLRELFEETGIKATADQVDFFQTVYVEYDDDRTQIIYHMYRLQCDERPDIDIDETEHIAYMWVTPAGVMDVDYMRDLDACIAQIYPQCV